MTSKADSRIQVAAVLQLLVGAIVVLGGAALVYFSVDLTGKALGIIHAALGLAGLSVGLLLWKKSRIGWTMTIWVNALIIAFSIASEAVLSALNSLASDQFVDSVIGTVLAVFIAAIVIALMTKADLKNLLRREWVHSSST